tara:strand:- start:1568 stop:1864 length:297 start_codon:yes stop_codon:yes gene_type:complete
MPELTKLEQLEKNVVDTLAAFDDTKAAFDYSFNKAAWDAATYAAAFAAYDAVFAADGDTVADAAADAAYVVYKAATYAAWVKARLELNNYLKEKDNEL